MGIGRKGFTIVELLIVIVVIAILAAITFVAFSGIQSRAHDAAIKSDFRAVVNLLEVYRMDNGSYPHDPAGNPGGVCAGSSGAAVIRPTLESIKMKLSTGSYNTTTANTNLLYIANSDGQKYALLGYAKGNPTYYITHEQKTPVVYQDNGTSQSEYPGGTPCGIADNLGISSPLTNTDLGFYYIFRQSGGGFQLWN